ncbi:MAG: hypothetical protein IPI28_07290 [Candidatus Omnitrophica bacterium]|nr:hypothetical protein [Candidatus Omnitrophota bacterium]
MTALSQEDFTGRDRVIKCAGCYHGAPGFAAGGELKLRGHHLRAPFQPGGSRNAWRHLTEVAQF